MKCQEGYSFCSQEQELHIESGCLCMRQEKNGKKINTFETLKVLLAVVIHECNVLSMPSLLGFKLVYYMLYACAWYPNDIQNIHVGPGFVSYSVLKLFTKNADILHLIIIYLIIISPCGMFGSLLYSFILIHSWALCTVFLKLLTKTSKGSHSPTF